MYGFKSTGTLHMYLTHFCQDVQNFEITLHSINRWNTVSLSIVQKEHLSDICWSSTCLLTLVVSILFRLFTMVLVYTVDTALWWEGWSCQWSTDCHQRVDIPIWRSQDQVQNNAEQVFIQDTTTQMSEKANHTRYKTQSSDKKYRSCQIA